MRRRWGSSNTRVGSEELRSGSRRCGTSPRVVSPDPPLAVHARTLPIGTCRPGAPWRPGRRPSGPLRVKRSPETVALTRRGRRAYRPRHSDESLMWWFTPRTGHSRDARRRVGALVGTWALLAQLALPPLHAWAAARDTEPPAAWVSARDETAPQLSARARRVPAHDASDCPVCQSLVQVRHFLAPPAPVPAATPWPQVRDVNVSISVASVTIGRLASPRGPPRPA